MNLVQQFEEKLNAAVQRMESYGGAEILLMSDAKPAISKWDASKGYHGTITLEDAQPVISAEIMAFAGAYVSRTGNTPLFNSENPLAFSYMDMQVRVVRSSNGVMAVFRDESCPERNYKQY